MQIFVTGMHRSGTSLTCRLLNMMGAYFGPEGCQWDPNDENPRGFWERKDFRALNDRMLEANGCTWDNVASWQPASLAADLRAEFDQQARQLLFRMEGFRPWVNKEPRFCLTFPFYEQFCEVPVVVLVARPPAEVALSLEQRNGISEAQALRLWCDYISSALEVSKNCRRVLVRHDLMMANPVAETLKLHTAMVRHGVRGLELPTELEINAFISPALYRARKYQSTTNDEVAALYEKLINAGN